MSDDENFPLSERSPSAETQTRGGQGQIPNNFDEENRENNQENQDLNRVKVGQDGENTQNKSNAFESKTKLKVHFKGWNGVASWKWIANDDTCGICRVAFDGCCPDCKLPGNFSSSES